MDDEQEVGGLFGVAPKWWLSAALVNNLTKEETVLAQENENLPMRQFAEVPAKVHVAYGLTRNLGDYNSLRIDVGLSLPCAPADKEAAYVEASKWVEDKMRESKRQIDSTRKGNTGI